MNGLDDGGVSSDEEFSCGEAEGQDASMRREDNELKDRLLRKFGSHLSSLKLEFSKKKKERKLPKRQRKMLLAWWTDHYRWPYPTEADKIPLAESTGLDPKQINNWFINQRKRHWKPSESSQLAVMIILDENFDISQGLKGNSCGLSFVFKSRCRSFLTHSPLADPLSGGSVNFRFCLGYEERSESVSKNVLHLDWSTYLALLFEEYPRNTHTSLLASTFLNEFSIVAEQNTCYEGL
ncbi:hypothetical protein HAX54_032734 [Datura stramonium]|uniref:Uncharacterized protein n=1 Tax=Datura stramonium TaxID=4076 RepID=A0ABS8SCV3_DATST|nr:hypothetical protein [Datura stramonium]